MEIDAATVKRIARLARLKVTDAEADALRGELSGILAFASQLGAVDTSHIDAADTRAAMRRRPDAVTDGNITEAVLANAPATEGGFFLVPKVVE